MFRVVRADYHVPVPEKKLKFLRDIAPEKFEGMEEPEYVFEDEDEYVKDRFEFVASKQIRDSDGFLDTYCMYYDTYEDQFVFVFDESDLYDDYFDWTCEGEREAEEWFDSYGPEEGYEVVACKRVRKTKIN